VTLGQASRFHQSEQERELARRQDEMDQRLKEAIDAFTEVADGTYEEGQQ
jgi:Skp family chaperone for outer membrane proteins